MGRLHGKIFAIKGKSLQEIKRTGKESTLERAQRDRERRRRRRRKRRI